MSAHGPLDRVPSPVLVLGAIASVQFGASIAVKLFSRVGPAGAVSLRLAAASVALAVVWRPRLRGRRRSHLGLAVLFGVVLAAMNLSFYESIDRIPLGIAVAIEFVGPLAVAVLGSRRRSDFVYVALAAVGIVALTRSGSAAHGIDLAGALFALAAGICWGIYIIVSARVGAAFEQGTGLALAMCVAAVLTLPAGLADGGSQLLSGQALWQGAAVGLLSSAIPYSFELEALRRIANAVFGVLMSLEPAVAAIAGLIVLGQQLSAREVVGIGLVVIASVGASRQARSGEAPVAV